MCVSVRDGRDSERGKWHAPKCDRELAECVASAVLRSTCAFVKAFQKSSFVIIGRA